MLFKSPKCIQIEFIGAGLFSGLHGLTTCATWSTELQTAPVLKDAKEDNDSTLMPGEAAKYQRDHQHVS